jgi:hypothetical protein
MNGRTAPRMHMQTRNVIAWGLSILLIWLVMGILGAAFLTAIIFRTTFSYELHAFIVAAIAAAR